MPMASSTAIKTEGTYWGYETEVEVTDSTGNYTFTTKVPRGYGSDIDYEIPFTTDGSVQYFTITMYNLSEEHAAVLKKGNHVKIKSGPTSLFDTLTEGKIVSREEDAADDLDYPIKIKCLAGKDYSKIAAIYSTAAGSSKVKHAVTIKKGEVIKWTSTKRKKVKLTFKKGTKPSTIVRRICRQAGIDVQIIHLKTDKPYKTAYTLSSKPYNALKSLAKRCGSKLYQRRAGLVIDDFSKPNPYDEHIYVTSVDGLLAEPTINVDDDGTTTYTMQLPLDPRIDAGTVMDVKSQTVNGFVRVISGTHNSDEWTTECEVQKVA